MYYVYQLLDGNKPFYIGKGKNRRMYYHRWAALKGKCENKHLENKIKKILNAGDDIKYKRTFFDNENDALDHEKNLISEIGLNNLCNISEGGDRGFERKHSIRTKKIISQKNRERWSDPNERKKQSKLLLKRYEDHPEIKEKISRSLIGRKLSEDTKRKMKGRKGWNTGNDSRKEYICKCGKSFKSYRKSTYCSNECRGIYKRNRVLLECDWCGSEVEKTPSKVKKNNFCSKQCSLNYLWKNRNGNNSKIEKK